MSWTSKTIQPESAAIEVASYKIFGLLDANNAVEKAFTASSVSIDNLKVGSWTFYVVGYNAAGDAIASSENKTIQIKVSETASANFSLNYLEEGSGTFTVNIKIAEANTWFDKIVLTLKNTDTSKQDPDAITIARSASASNGYYTYSSSTTVTTGNYEVTARAYSGDDPVALMSMESLFIFKDIESTFEKTFMETGKAATPVFTPSDSVVTSSTSIAIASTTPDSYIYYTTDPDESPVDGTFYSGTFNVSKNTTLYAIAGADGMFMSDVVSKEYHVKAAAPTASVEVATYDSAQTVYLSTTTTGSEIRYTIDGSTPTAESILYTDSGIAVDKNMTIKAVTINSEYDNSDVVSFEYGIRTQTPGSNVPEDFYGKKQSVILSAASGADIYYTLDGTVPSSTNGTKFSGDAIEIAETKTLKAIAYREGYEPSLVFSETISIVHLSAPVFSLSTDTYHTDQTLEITQAENAAIHYTTDGTDPTPSSAVYSAPIAIDRTMTVKAIGVKDTFDDTEPVAVAFTMLVKALSATNEGGEFNAAQTLAFSTETPNVSIY